MEKISKKRTSSRCREWERQRRLKFNEALSKLSAIVRSLEGANSTEAEKEGESLQFPKIEVIQRATVCLENCSKENTQLKAEVLALQVSLDRSKNKIDASTQVQIIVKKVRPRKNRVKVKGQQKPFQQESITIIEAPNNTNTTTIVTPTVQKQPILVPKGSKRPENTYVLLPSPYIFPQRPVMFPPMTPTILLVDPSELSKPNVPIINRNINDITKTTMVNILPISAYSRPLSANKTKKNNAKQKTDNSKKAKSPKSNNSKANVKKPPEPSNSESNNSIATEDTNKDSKSTNENLNRNENVEKPATKAPDKIPVPKVQSSSPAAVVTLTVQSSGEKKTNLNNITDSSACNNVNKQINITNNTIMQSTGNNVNNEISPELSKPIIENNKSNNAFSIKAPDKPDSIQISNVIQENENEKDKSKETKISNILDTSLCENTVETGNARLELAEELLAASPTAAFLMSFPLVSGNRADSPAEEAHIPIPVNVKDNSPTRNESRQQSIQFYEKAITDIQKKTTNTDKVALSLNQPIKQSEQQKYIDSNLVPKATANKIPVTSTFSNENPFLPMPSLITSSSVADTNFGIDFDCSINKSLPNQTTSYSNNNFFYKNDPFNTVKSSIYSTSNITTTPDFNNIGLYPCAVDKFNSKTNTNVEDNLMKIGSSRLTYDIDLGWSHKSLDFISCTSGTNTFAKDNILTTNPVTVPYSTSYNPFNPEFHAPLVSSNNKKDNASSKPTTSFPDISNFYSQAPNIWSEDVSFYSSNKSSTKQQNFLNIDYLQPNTANNKQNHQKQYDTKLISESIPKPSTSIASLNAVDKFTKKSPTKTHINWMTSEIRSMQTNFQTPSEPKPSNKTTFNTIDMGIKKTDTTEANYFPIQMHNFTAQPVQEEFPVWPSTRPVGTAEITMEPPPINLPTLIGDLALGPHEKKKAMDTPTKIMHQNDPQNCSNFLSVTQLMNRSSETSRYQGLNIDINKSAHNAKQHNHNANDLNRKQIPQRQENHVPCYSFSDNKLPYETNIQFTQQKQKTTKPDKSFKSNKNNYSAESLIRSGATQKILENNDNNKFISHLPAQKYNDFTGNDVAQVSHFPAIIDYSDNTFVSQQFSGTTLYNSTTNTLSNSFYTNLMPSNTNIMAGNFTSAPFPSEFIDYNQAPDCNFNNHKYDELKMRNNQPVFQQEKVPANYKNSRRDSAAKHKLECSKKESNKKYQSKRAKVNTDGDDWNDTSNLWQNKNSRRHGNFVSEELTFPNYNQMPTQYQTDFFNSHLMSTNMQSVGGNVDRSLASFPITSRANFNLSTIFPEITMKVQS